jgi:gliding motility-associated-like protein
MDISHRGHLCQYEGGLRLFCRSDREPLPAPAYTDLIIPRYSDATLTVKNHSAGDYKLFTDASGTALSQQNQTGSFTIAAIQSDATFYIQQSRGSCYSPLVPVSIKVVDKSYFTIPNAFTPGNDGKNDRLRVRVKGHIELNYFKIYNRWGQMIFETRKLNDGLDGTWKGVLQQTGTYIWVAEGKDLLGTTIRGKGSFVLIR